MSSVRPFLFTQLRRLTRSQVAIEMSLGSHFGERSCAPDFAASLAALLARYWKAECQIGVCEAKAMSRQEVAAMLPAVGCLIVVGAAPGDRKLLVDLDLHLAYFTVEHLLGGSGDAEHIQRPLTDIEEGVLSFLLLKVMNHLQEGLRSGRELALYLDRFASRLEDVRPLLDAEADFALLGVRLAAGKHPGYVRIVIPGSLVTERFGKPLPQAGASAHERAAMTAALAVLGETAVAGRIEMATLPDLSADDVANLRAGDIIIIENHQVTKTSEGLEGLVFIKLGAGKNGGLRCRLRDGEPQRIEVVEIVVHEQPAEEPMVDDGSPEPPESDNLAETEGLLRDVTTPVAIELGRLRLSAAQVVRLRKGQILRLPRAASDPVDLVVNGKVFARGELIEVDGELGVRLLHVVGAT